LLLTGRSINATKSRSRLALASQGRRPEGEALRVAPRPPAAQVTQNSIAPRPANGGRILYSKPLPAEELRREIDIFSANCFVQPAVMQGLRKFRRRYPARHSVFCRRVGN